MPSVLLSVLSKQFYGNKCRKSLFQSVQRNFTYLFNLNKYSCTTFRFQSTQPKLQVDYVPNSSHKLNCDIYILTGDGALQVHQGPFDRAQVCEEYGVEPRDLQKIDTDLLINVPIIDVRQKKFICFSFRRLRSLVQFDRSIFFVPSTSKIVREPAGIKNITHWEGIAQVYRQNVRYIHKIYNERFVDQALNNADAIPFEFRITEINLEAVAHQLNLRANELLSEFKNVRERAYTRITVGSLRELALLKEKADQHKRNSDLAHRAITDVLAQDEDMVGMYLTDKRQRDISDHIQIELLLEACTKQMAEVRRLISDLADSIRTLENATGFMLDAVRNDLIGFEIRINIISMGLGLGAFVAGLYGMNFAHGFEESPYAFYVVTGTTCCFIAGITAVGMIRLLRYRKIRLRRSNKTDVF